MTEKGVRNSHSVQVNYYSGHVLQRFKIGTAIVLAASLLESAICFPVPNYQSQHTAKADSTFHKPLCGDVGIAHKCQAG